MSYLYGQEKENIYENILRYSDRVDQGNEEPPQGLENILYYSSKDLRPFYNIPYSLAGQETVPTLAETMFSVPIDLITKGKTDTHDPVGDYIKKDPVGSLVQLPAEAALWITGGKAVSAAAKGFQRFSPLIYQSSKVVVDGKPETIFRGLTFKDSPVLSWQNGKLVKSYDPIKVTESFQKINPSTLGRDGIEAGLGSGVEKELIYSEKTLGKMVESNVIPQAQTFDTIVQSF